MFLHKWHIYVFKLNASGSSFFLVTFSDHRDEFILSSL